MDNTFKKIIILVAILATIWGSIPADAKSEYKVSGKVITLVERFNPHARVGRDRLCFYDMCFSALIGVKCESLGLHLQKYSFFIEFASNILIIKWCERIGISALLMVLVYIIRSALKLKELSIPMCSTFPSQ